MPKLGSIAVWLGLVSGPSTLFKLKPGKKLDFLENRYRSEFES